MERGAFLTLVGNLTLAHTIGTVCAQTLAAIAPIAAQAYGVPVYMIGYQASCLALGIIIALVFCSNLALRWGATRVNQAGLALLAFGTILLTVPSFVTVVPASIAIGIGYGSLTPAASHVLIRFTPAHRRNVVFSLKQSGVPLGGILAATIMPAVTVTLGWRWALWLGGLAAIVVAVTLERWRKRWDDDRRPATPLVAANPFMAVAMIWRRPRLRLMGFAGAGIVASQICLQSYTVAMFYEQFSLTLVQAGLILTISQIGGVCGRLGFGWLADHRRDALGTLALLTAVLVGATLCTGTLGLGWPLALVYVLFFVFGATASGWNGAFLGEVARLAPTGQVSPATGGSLFFVNVSSIAAPIVFALAYSLSGSFSLTFGLLVLPAITALLCLRQAKQSVAGGTPGSDEKKPQH